jgi:hypothetical protein
MLIEITMVILSIIGIIVAYFILKTGIHLLINAVLGIIIFFIANNIFNVGINYTIPALLVSALAGIPGAAIVILLHVFGIAF